MELCGKLHARAALTPVLVGCETGWAPEPVLTLWRREKFTRAENWIPAVQPVSRIYTDWVIRTPLFIAFQKLYQLRCSRTIQWTRTSIMAYCKSLSYNKRETMLVCLCCRIQFIHVEWNKWTGNERTSFHILFMDVTRHVVTVKKAGTFVGLPREK
jgi:hypothetical protein